MAVLEILSIPDPRLKVKAEKVTDVSTIQTLIDDMLETLYATGNGIGLASTQV
ncbi:peptide deformylase, partial [Vibrio parahaemolyticus]|nr:peptide deformylase [Vibrio parahaemolyticus]MDG2687380.1 peptide deformylase [Vibrio parahaemolyticus]